jgi:hypothetical protein
MLSTKHEFGIGFQSNNPSIVLMCRLQVACLMRFCTLSLLTLVVFFQCVCLTGRGQSGTTPVQTPEPDWGQLLEVLAPTAADPCTALAEEKENTENAESGLFQRAAAEVASALNSDAAGPLSPQESVAKALEKLQQTSATANAAWMNENRFHFEILDLQPMLAVKMTIRTQAAYLVFGIPHNFEGKGNRLWKLIGEDSLRFDHPAPRTLLELYPLKRGPSGHPRFLAKFDYFGCAGSLGVEYEIREWDTSDESLSELLKQSGSFGMDQAADGHGPTEKDPFAAVGRLNSNGARITLPYCTFTAIDTWDNPSLCAADTYDLSGDDIQFVEQRTNRPELVPVAKAIEYAEKHDYPAVLAYCGSEQVARKIVRELPHGRGFDAGIEVLQLSAGRKRVRSGYSNEPGFAVEKRGDRWLVVSYSAN